MVDRNPDQMKRQLELCELSQASLLREVARYRHLAKTRLARLHKVEDELRDLKRKMKENP